MGDTQDEDLLSSSQVDLKRIRESRVQRTRAAMMEFDREIAVSVLPEPSHDDDLSVDENAAICIQKCYRGYLGRKQYRSKLLEQYEKDEEERRRKTKQQTEEAEILVETYRLQLEAEEEGTIHRNKQRMLNVYATRIQRAWRHYVANQPAIHGRQGDSFEEQVYHATGLNVSDFITSNTSHTSGTVQLEYNKDTSIPSSNSSEMQACISKTSMEDLNVRSPDNADFEEDVHREDLLIDNNNDSVILKGDRRVRFDLPSTEEIENSSKVTQQQLVRDGEVSSVVEKMTIDSNSSGVEEVMPADQVRLLGYTKLRELKCSLETKLNSLSDQLISELQSRERLQAHKEFLLEKIQNLSRLVQNQHRLKREVSRRKVKS